jgi:hypothetical protein
MSSYNKGEEGNADMSMLLLERDKRITPPGMTVPLLEANIHKATAPKSMFLPFEHCVA